MEGDVYEPLESFDGGTAQLWHAVATHNRVVLELSRRTAEHKIEYRYLLLLLCRRIEISIGWPIERLTITEEVVDGKTLYRVQDGDNMILCGEWRLRKDYTMH